MYATKFQPTLIILLVVLAGGMLFPAAADAQNVHALLVIMDADETIGKSMVLDKQLVEKFLTYVNVTNPVKKTVYLSSKGRTQSNRVLNWIRDVRPRADDVVFVYYTGHGGMVSNTDRRTFLNLTDERLYRSDLVAAMKDVSCRLKLLITDACSSAPSAPGSKGKTISYGAQVVGKKHIKNLLFEHEGFLHINGATESEYGWCNPDLGGSTFTVSLMEAIGQRADTNKDGFVAWAEVCTLAKKDTNVLFKQIYPRFSSRKKADLKARGITGQNPQVYSMPKRRAPRSSGSDADLFASLWELDNPRAGFDIDLKTAKPVYHVNDYLTLELSADQPCYVTVLNWDKEGTLAVLVPNQFKSKNYVSSGRIHTFPSSADPFDILLPPDRWAQSGSRSSPFARNPPILPFKKH